MNEPKHLARYFALAVRWAARLTSLVVLVVATLALVQGSWPNPAHDTALAPLAAFLLMAACAGLILAWLLEGTGSMLAVCSVAALYVTSLVAAGRLPGGWLLSVAGISGFLFILSRALNVALRHEEVSDG